MEFEKAKQIVENFEIEVQSFLKQNALSELKNFSDLQEKEKIGNDYRHDQWYFENISNFKAKYFSLRAYFTKYQSNNSDRVLSRKTETIISYVEDQLKMLDVILNMAKQRIKFYESTIYLISNFNYGNY